MVACAPIREHLIHSGTPPYQVRSGDRIRLDPAAARDGWRIRGVGTTEGVLWPVEGESFYVARCPGKSEIYLMKGDWPAGGVQHLPDRNWTPPQYGPPPEQAMISVVVEAGGQPIPTTCKLGFDPPRTKNTGVLDLEMMRAAALSMRLAEEFVVVAPKGCEKEWSNPVLSDSAPLQRIDDDAGRPRFRAVAPGATFVIVPYYGHCYAWPDGIPTSASHTREMRLLVVVD